MGILRAGELDQRIRIERAGDGADDGYTTKPGPYGELATVWARVRPAPGAERFASGENAATAPTVFRIRYQGWSPPLNPKDRVRYPIDGGQVFDIKSAIVLGRNEAIEIFGVARTDQ